MVLYMHLLILYCAHSSLTNKRLGKILLITYTVNTSLNLNASSVMYLEVIGCFGSPIARPTSPPHSLCSGLTTLYNVSRYAAYCLYLFSLLRVTPCLRPLIKKEGMSVLYPYSPTLAILCVILRY